MRDAFLRTATALLDEDPRTAMVLAEISAAALAPAAAAHPDRVINVGIREQLMVSVAGGLALTGLRPMAHSYAPFLIERAWEQVKLDLNHQEVGAILVSVGASFDGSTAGRTHQSPGDVALLDTLAGWTVHVPGHAAEVEPVLRAAAADDGPVYIRLSTQHNTAPHPGSGGLTPLRTGSRAVVVAVGPMLDPVLAATEGLDVTVAYTHTPRPFDGAGLRALTAAATDIVLVEPYQKGTSARHIAEALRDRPHRLLALGATAEDLHRYGTPEQHLVANGLDPFALRASISPWLAGG